MCAKYDTNLEKYKVLYTAYADEIRNLWQRSVFLGTFMVLVWTGYGALQLKAIERNSQNPYIYHYVSIGLCLVIIVLSLLWIAMAKGSKFVQEAHEEHIKNLNYDLLEIDIETIKFKRLFCNLDFYQSKLEKRNISSNKLFTSYRYSPSKINIALGWVSFIISFILLNTHLFMADGIKQHFHSIISVIATHLPNNEYMVYILVAMYSLFIFLIALFIKLTLKGKSKTRDKVARKDSQI